MNQVVYALLSEADSFRFPYLLQPNQNPAAPVIKMLQNATAVTDASGVATFKNLGFQVSVTVGFFDSFRSGALSHGTILSDV